VAQQIVIDIVAETKKLTEGLDDANKQLGTIDGKLKGVAKAATAAASAFVLKKGISFLKEGIEEAKEAAATMKAAETAFGKGSKALEEITKDAEKFAKELAVDNDELIQLGTQLGSRLPDDVKSSSVELVKIFKDVEAFTGGAVSAEGATAKLAKAFADGELKAGELQKIFPGLKQSVYEQAEALSAAGKNQDALNLLISEGSKKYGDAAAQNVTASQRFDQALADLKETVGTKLLDPLNKLVDVATKILDAFSKLPEPVQNFSLGLLALVGIGGPLISFVANLQASLVQLGLLPAASGAAATGLNLVKVALAGLGIGLVIAAIVLLIQHWDDVTRVVKDVYEAVKKWIGDMVDKAKELLGDVIKWIEENWPKILAVLTGPFGLFALWVVEHKDDIVAKFNELWEAVKTAVVEKVASIIGTVQSLWNLLKDFIVDYFSDKAESFLGAIKSGWNNVKEFVSTIVEIIKLTVGTKFLEMFNTVVEWVTAIKTGVVNKFNELKDGAIEQFNKLKAAAGRIWDDIKQFIIDVANNIKNKLGEVYGFMVEVGKDIARGIWQGLSSMTNWFKLLLAGWVNANIPEAVRKILKISSPSRVMMGIGENITEGLYMGMGLPGAPGINLPTINVGAGGAAGVNITINAGLGTDPIALGREVQKALNSYGKYNI
jgi:hypothetical protein